VTDTGIGIHPDFLPRVFERFQQGNADSQAGLGLGLAIVKNLVELHGGTIVARSGGIGQGSQFIVSLPRQQPSRASASAAGEAR
jgi:signal transduction histidine kinase